MQSEAIQTQGLLKSRNEVREEKNLNQSRNPKIMVTQEKEPKVVQNLPEVKS
jgi:hypothetical protein